MSRSRWGARVVAGTALLMVLTTLISDADAQRRRRRRRGQPEETPQAQPAQPGQPAQAEQPLPAQQPAPQITIVARDDQDLVFLDDAFSSARFGELVRLDAEASGEITGPELESSLTAQAQARPVERGSIDQEVLTRIIVDRARRLAMRAVADAIGEAGGPITQRRYVQDAIAAITALLTDRTGMQNTHIEELIGIMVRAVLADAIVRMGFQSGDLLDPCVWRRNVYAEDVTPVLEGAACRTQPIAELASLCTGGDTAPPECALGRGRAAQWRPFLPARSGRDEALVLRAYLIDLAYWALGRIPLFAHRTALPRCAFDRGHPHRALCAYVDGAPDDSEREARVTAMLGIDDAFSGIQIAQDLMAAMRPPAEVHLAALVEAFGSRPSLGNLRSSYLLTHEAWAQFQALDAWAAAWKDIQALSRAIVTFQTETTNVASAISRLKSAAAAVDQSSTSLCVGTNGSTPFGRSLRGFCNDAGRSGQRRPPRPPPPGAPVPENPCAGVNPEITGWARNLSSTDRVDRAAERPIGEDRLTGLCVPRELIPILDRTSGNSPRARGFSDALDRVQTDAATLRSAIDGWRSAGLPADVVDLPLEGIDDTIGAGHPVADALARLHAGVTGPDLLPVVRYGNINDSNVWIRELRDSGRAIGGLVRLLRLVRLLDVRVLRERELVALGDVADVMRGLGGDGALLLDRLGPVITLVSENQDLGIELMLLILERIPVEDIVLALGVAVRPEDWCEEDEAGLACWMNRVLLVLREATDVDETRVAIDGNRLVKTLGAMGDDFRRRSSWRGYFHLTIGLGEMVNYTGDQLSAGRLGAGRLTPIMAEQIGFGFASPSFWGDNVNFRFGLFASGFLYRVVLDSEESNAVMFGGFLAFDLYEMLEVYVAPMVLLYPPVGEDSQPASFALAAGVQIPLGDYLAAL